MRGHVSAGIAFEPPTLIYSASLGHESSRYKLITGDVRGQLSKETYLSRPERQRPAPQVQSVDVCLARLCKPRHGLKMLVLQAATFASGAADTGEVDGAVREG